MSDRLDPSMHVREALARLPLGHVIHPGELEVALDGAGLVAGRPPHAGLAPLPTPRDGVHIVYARPSLFPGY